MVTTNVRERDLGSFIAEAQRKGAKEREKARKEEAEANKKKT